MENNSSRFHVHFYEKRKIFYGISIGIIVLGLIFNIIFGVSLDIQFSGGAMIQYAVTGGEVSEDEIQSIVKDTVDRDSTVTMNQGYLDDQDIHVTISFAGNEAITLEDQNALADTLTEEYDELTFTLEESSSVDPTMGQSFLLKCLVCVAITFVLLLIYIGYRFRKIGGLSAGVTALIALLHDVLIVYFVFVIFQMPIDDIFIAVILTILGYSLNDTIVIYDRIRENRKKLGQRVAYNETVDLSLNQTLRRSLLTTATTFMALLVICIVSVIYGLTTVTTFVLPMMVGVIAGCYSSLCIAAPLYATFKLREKKA